ncbi:uncharacterized protein LOC119999410 [Tripterygium wilfordii]|uniref:uncharacterized protein LOC119999410 n=1 Tax=Tripterygium wilfordii TaxID=458696 RepID=UPI0018F850A3|nr:uncharacterized protein LOC119999410 [Tripterygium wilfordii]
MKADNWKLKVPNSMKERQSKKENHVGGKMNLMQRFACISKINEVVSLVEEVGDDNGKDRANEYSNKPLVDHFSKGNLDKIGCHDVDRNKEKVMGCADVLAPQCEQGKIGTKTINVLCLKINYQPYMMFKYPSVGWTSFNSLLCTNEVNIPKSNLWCSPSYTYPRNAKGNVLVTSGKRGQEFGLLEMSIFANKFCCERLKDAYEWKLASLVLSRDDVVDNMEYAIADSASVLAASFFDIVLHEWPNCLNNGPMVVFGVQGSCQALMGMIPLSLKLTIPRRPQWDPGGASCLS